jgi:hypothetical protein
MTTTLSDHAAIPPQLVRDIRDGNCVAFVGAGFSAAAVPGWRDLLLAAADSCRDGSAAERARALLGAPSPAARELEAAAQILRDADPAGLVEALRQSVGAVVPDAVMARRLELLRGIPFAAILTTNFDPLLPGSPPTPRAFLDVLRPERHRWWDERFWDRARPGPQVVKLHGDVAGPPGREPELVLSRRDYRRLLYGTPGYLTFLRSLFAIRSVLYLGFSFTDAYLNELRSEVLALLGHEGGEVAPRPIAWAVVPDASEAECAYYRRHEGIEVLTYDAQAPPRHGGFDRILEALHRETHPAHFLGRLLAGRRIVWLDPQPANNAHGMVFLAEAAAMAATSPCRVDRVGDVSSALAKLGDDHPPADLVITHWGHDRERDPTTGAPCSTAAALLAAIRRADLRVPVIVFSDRRFAADNRPLAYRLGACDLLASWSVSSSRSRVCSTPAIRAEAGAGPTSWDPTPRGARRPFRQPFATRLRATACTDRF